jgi:hypothetical protein
MLPATMTTTLQLCVTYRFTPKNMKRKHRVLASPLGNATPPPMPPMSFAQLLQLSLDPALPLPLHIDLGYRSCNWENGTFQWGGNQTDFTTLTRELMQLMLRLQASPHVILLNLHDHGFGDSVMGELAVPMAALSQLQVLVLSCTRPSSSSSSTFHAAAMHGQHRHRRHRHDFTLYISDAMQITPSVMPVALRWHLLWPIFLFCKCCISAVCDFVVLRLVCGDITSGSSPPASPPPPPPPHPLRTVHLSCIVGNSIGDAGCIALSSSLAHLSHLEKLFLHGEVL